MDRSPTRMNRQPTRADTDPHRRRYLAVLASGLAASAAGCLGGPLDSLDGDDGGDIDTLPDGVDIDLVREDLASPWAVTVLPDGQLLVTERDTGQLRRIDPDGDDESISGVPLVDSAGQGGLLDVVPHPNYPDEPWLYFTFAASVDGRTATRLARGRLEPGSTSLSAVETLYTAMAVDSSGHYGSRLVFGEDDRLYMTVGDRQSKAFGPDHFSQDTTNGLGATLRFDPDGSVPEDNPFVGEAGHDPIYSYGHRNTQAMTVHPETGALWQADHGERDGDAIFIVERGGNHGWPVAHYGCQYGTDDPVGDEPGERDDVVDPVYHWPCGSGGFPPSGMAFYEGPIDDWQGDLFVGNLAGQYLGRFSVNGTAVDERDPLLADRGWRVRDVAVANGDLYAVVDADPAPLVRLTATT